MFKFASKKAGMPAVEVVGAKLPPTMDTDETSYVKVGWIIVLVGFVGSLLWAAFAPLSKGVPVQGTVVVAGNRKDIQQSTGGIIQSILVHDGDEVKVGQVLVKMNNAQTLAQEGSVRAQYLTELAVKARLVAEATNAKTITFPPELIVSANAHNLQVEDDIELQKQLLISRRIALQAAQGAQRETIAGYSAQLAGANQSLGHKQVEQKTLNDQLTGIRKLADEGYVPRSKLQDIERQVAELDGEMATQLGTAGMLQDDYMKDVRTQLTEVQRDTDELKSKLNESEFNLANSEVRSPVDGTVFGVSVFTDGGVVSPGAKLMEVVPSGEPLEIEGELPVDLIDKVQQGLPVDLMFTAFNQNSTPHIPGTLSFISPDRLINEHTGLPYYKVRAKVTPEGMKLLAHLNVKPGMPVELFVNAGQRSMLSYLFKPVLDRAHSALSEN